MEDRLWWNQDAREHWIHGYGHYHETDEKVGGQWLIKTRRLSRIRVDRGTRDRGRVVRSGIGA